MLNKTHLVCGIATALAVMRPTTPAQIAITVVGGTVGGTVPDVDTLKSRTSFDNVISQSVAIGILVLTILLDRYYDFGIMRYLQGHMNTTTFGLLLYAACLIYGFYSPHRTFTHSVSAMFLFSLAVFFVYPNASISFICGFGSHILLDLLNKKKVYLFYPFPIGICLGFCYSNGFFNRVFMIIGSLASGILLSYYLFQL